MSYSRIHFGLNVKNLCPLFFRILRHNYMEVRFAKWMKVTPVWQAKVYQINKSSEETASVTRVAYQHCLIVGGSRGLLITFRNISIIQRLPFGSSNLYFHHIMTFQDIRWISQATLEDTGLLLDLTTDLFAKIHVQYSSNCNKGKSSWLEKRNYRCVCYVDYMDLLILMILIIGKRCVLKLNVNL